MLSNMLDRNKSKSAPAVYNPTANIIISFGNSIRTLDIEHERQVAFERIYPQINQSDLLKGIERTPTPFRLPMNKSVSISEGDSESGEEDPESGGSEGLRKILHEFKRFPKPECISTMSLPSKTHV